jgi:hypothetical protein
MQFHFEQAMTDPLACRQRFSGVRRLGLQPPLNSRGRGLARRAIPGKSEASKADDHHRPR